MVTVPLFSYLMCVHSPEVVERSKELWKEAQGHGHGVVLCNVVEAAFNELHPDQALHVVTKKTRQGFLSFGSKTVGKLKKIV